MKQRKLGTLSVSEIGFGCMGLDFSYGHRVSREEGVALIRQAAERGVTFFDTAEVYGPFTNEDMVGDLDALASAAEGTRLLWLAGMDTLKLCSPA